MKLLHGIYKVYLNLRRLLRAVNHRINQLYRFIEFNELTGLLILAFLIGIVGGYGAVGFRMMLGASQNLFWGAAESLELVSSHIPTLPWYVRVGMPAFGGLIVGPIIYFFSRETKGSGVPEVIESISTKGGWIRGRVIPLKALASSLSIGSGGSAGREGPIVQIGSGAGSLIGQYLSLNEEKRRILVGCGASAGGAFGKIIHALFPTITGVSGSYALVGMDAVVAGAAHAPLTAILILFEMTRDYHIILPLMLTCIISTVISMQFQTNNIYTKKLLKRGIDIQKGGEAPLLRSIKVRDAMSTEVISLKEGASTEEIMKVFRESHHTHFPVIKEDSNRVIGILNYTDYWDYIEAESTSRLLIARDLARTPAITIRCDDNLLTALRKISSFNTKLLPVVRRDKDEELVGVLSRNDIINMYNKRLSNQEFY